MVGRRPHFPSSRSASNFGERLLPRDDSPLPATPVLSSEASWASPGPSYAPSPTEAASALSTFHSEDPPGRFQDISAPPSPALNEASRWPYDLSSIDPPAPASKVWSNPKTRDRSQSEPNMSVILGWTGRSIHRGVEILEMEDWPSSYELSTSDGDIKSHPRALRFPRRNLINAGVGRSTWGRPRVPQADNDSSSEQSRLLDYRQSRMNSTVRDPSAEGPSPRYRCGSAVRGYIQDVMNRTGHRSSAEPSVEEGRNRCILTATHLDELPDFRPRRVASVGKSTGSRSGAPRDQGSQSVAEVGEVIRRLGPDERPRTDRRADYREPIAHVPSALVDLLSSSLLFLCWVVRDVIRLLEGDASSEMVGRSVQRLRRAVTDAGYGGSCTIAAYGEPLDRRPRWVREANLPSDGVPSTISYPASDAPILGVEEFGEYRIRGTPVSDYYSSAPGDPADGLRFETEYLRVTLDFSDESAYSPTREPWRRGLRGFPSTRITPPRQSPSHRLRLSPSGTSPQSEGWSGEGSCWSSSVDEDPPSPVSGLSGRVRQQTLSRRQHIRGHFLAPSRGQSDEVRQRRLRRHRRNLERSESPVSARGRNQWGLPMYPPLPTSRPFYLQRQIRPRELPIRDGDVRLRSQPVSPIGARFRLGQGQSRGSRSRGEGS